MAGKDKLMDLLIDNFMPHLTALLQPATRAEAGLDAAAVSIDGEAATKATTKGTTPADASTAADTRGAAPEPSEAEALLAEAVAQEHEAYVYCFVSVVQRLGQEATAQQFRAKLTGRGLVVALAKMLAETLPGADADKNSPLWGEAVAHKSLGWVLQLLTGVTRGYQPAQEEVAGTGVLASVHVLEEKASEQHMGSLAEELLVALAEGNDKLGQAIGELRAATLEKKRNMAQAQRERLLKEMGLAVGQDASKAFEEQAKAMGWEEVDLSDDDGLVCVICHEGYKYKPEEVLGVYVLNRRCSISQVCVCVRARAVRSRLCSGFLTR